MVRPITSDYLHSMRFHVEMVDPPSGGSPGYLQGGTADLRLPHAGFSACTTPELSSEAVEYKEGHFIYPRKYPGNPSVSDITMSRGVARLDSSLFSWMQATVEGGDPTGTGSYRGDIDIKHFHRREMFAGGPNIQNVDLTNTNPARIYHVRESFPIRCKVASDLDATASEISVQELDVAYEFFTVEEIAPT